jgi:hypothetical protein
MRPVKLAPLALPKMGISGGGRGSPQGEEENMESPADDAAGRLDVARAIQINVFSVSIGMDWRWNVLSSTRRGQAAPSGLGTTRATLKGQSQTRLTYQRPWGAATARIAISTMVSPSSPLSTPCDVQKSTCRTVTGDSVSGMPTTAMNVR